MGNTNSYKKLEEEKFIKYDKIEKDDKNEETIYIKNIPPCFNNIYNNFKNYYKDLNEPYNLCQEKYDECASSCNNDKDKLKCIEQKDCKILYTCKDIIGDINMLIDIVNKLDEKNKSINFTDVNKIGIIINNNLTSDDKKKVKEMYYNELDCSNKKKPCIMNSLLLLHLVLLIISRKLSIIYNLTPKNLLYDNNIKKIENLQYNLKNCNENINLPTNEETYQI